MASDLEDQHHAEIPELLIVESNSMQDLLTIFSEHITMKFKEGNVHKTVTGKWCLPCR
jgi:hypothetical protein